MRVDISSYSSDPVPVRRCELVMLDESLGWASFAFALAGMIATLFAAWTWPRGPRCRCRGPGAALVDWMSPWRFFWRGRCWYNLTGLQTDESSQVRCPECGHHSTAKQVMLDGRRFRWEWAAVASMLLACAAFMIPWIRGGTWTRSLPTVALVFMEQSQADLPDLAVHAEVDRRVNNGIITGFSAGMIAQKLAHDLRDDDTHWNGERAEQLLDSLWPSSQPALEAALRSGDAQARLIAARVLRSRCDTPSADLLWACVQDLRDDSDEVRWYLSLGNASAAADYLVTWAADATQALETGMKSNDPQQRLLSAAIAGQAHQTQLIEHAAPILIDHLRDNKISGDAKVAAPALMGFGTDVIPYLQPHVEIDDAQLRAIVRSIIERLTNPNRSIHRLQNPMPHITDLTDDPLSLISVGESARDLRMRRR